MNSGRGWAWAMYWRGQWHLCNWAEPTRKRLVAGGKPSPEAKPVYVKIAPFKKEPK